MSYWTSCKKSLSKLSKISWLPKLIIKPRFGGGWEFKITWRF